MSLPTRISDDSEHHSAISLISEFVALEGSSLCLGIYQYNYEVDYNIIDQVKHPTSLLAYFQKRQCLDVVDSMSKHGWQYR